VSPLLNRMGIEFFMWTVDMVDSPDVVLFDDLRNCAVNEAGADITRVTAMGMSGGALFTTVIARDRGDTLASIIEMSGGSDIDMFSFDTPLSAYDTPAYTMPAALVSGGTNDVWPGGGTVLVDFEEATDTLTSALVDDGHFVVRCHHSQGHTVPFEALELSWSWIDAHRFGEASPFIDEGIADFGDWCAVAD
jgi:predicted peptidase